MSEQIPNRKQELFCRFVARGETYSQAYELAGYNPSSSNASTMANRPEIKDRIQVLRDEHDNEQMELKYRLAKVREDGDPSLVEVGAEWNFNRVMDMIAENVRLAQVAGEYKAANDALKMMGEALNMFEKAQKANGNATGTQGPLALIGQITQHLAGPGGGVSAELDDPLAPRVRRP